MLREEILSELTNIMVGLHPGIVIEIVNENTNILTDLGLDSFSLLLLNMEIEKAFDITLVAERDVKIQTIGDVMDMIEERLSKR